MARPKKTSTTKRSFRDGAKVAAADVSPPGGTELTDGWLTQFGTDWFREIPRFEKPEFDISTLRGQLTLEQTCYAMFGRKPRPGHSARHFDVKVLVSARYRCLHTGWAQNPDHASILASCADITIEAHKAWWNSGTRVTLDKLEGGRV